MGSSKGTRLIANRHVSCAVLVASLLGVAPLHAEDAGTEGSAAASTIANSQNNFQGDRVTFPVNMTVKVDEGNGVVTQRCLKAGTKLRGVGQKDATTINFVVISCSPWFGFLGSKPPENCNVLCDGNGELKTGSTVQIELAEVQKRLPNRYGLAYGALVVPFKFQLTGDHQFTGSATLGPYVGYRFDTENYGLATTVAAFAGISNIAVAKTTTDSTTMKTSTSTEQLAGFGYGGAVMVEVKGGFQAGAVFGFDSVGSNQGFQYNNKPWLALELGYSFSQ